MILRNFIKETALDFAMTFCLADLQHIPAHCKNMIIEILGSGASLSAKKIHCQIKERYSFKISYQAVHKALLALTEQKVVKKYGNEYYLHQDWVNYLSTFVQGLKEGKQIPSLEAPPLAPFDYCSTSLLAAAIHFVPFYLGKMKLKLPKQCSIIHKEKNKATFQFKSNLYCWYSTGIAVQIIRESARSQNVINFLLERRKTHRQILSGQSPSSQEILEIINLINPSSKPKTSYVMSIYEINPPSNMSERHLANLLRLITEPALLGISDNPKEKLGEKHFEMARSFLQQLAQNEIKCTTIFEVDVDKTRRVFASWSNVVFLGGEKSPRELLVQLESDLQHLWFYFHMLKNEIRQAIRSKNGKKMQAVYRNMSRHEALWHQFQEICATEDSYTLLLKEALIKTSKIEKKYIELQNVLKGYCPKLKL
ncbi:MAG: hypothetical protein AB1668_03030 [Nanoarchaeota archaeon]